MVFENCTFDEPVTIRDSEATLLEFRSCMMPAFDGRNLRLAGDLSFTDTHVGRIDLFGALVGGQLWLTGSHVGSKSDARAINAPSVQVTGGVYGHHLRARGGINLRGAHIGAALELHDANLSTDGHSAVPRVQPDCAPGREDHELSDQWADRSVRRADRRPAVAQQFWCPILSKFVLVASRRA